MSATLKLQGSEYQPSNHYLEQELYALMKSDNCIFNFLQESSLDGLWYWDLKNPDVEWMNANFWTTLGYDPKQMPHKPSAWQSIINPEDLASATKNLYAHLDNPKVPYDQIVRYTHRKGHTVWIRCRGMAVRDETGEPIRVIGAHIDITAQKKYEDELKQRIADYDTIVNSAQLGTWKWEIETGEVTINQFAAQMLGYRLEELSNITVDQWQEMKHPEDLKKFTKVLNKLFKKGSGPIDFEVRIRHKKGHYLWIRKKGRLVAAEKSNESPVISCIHENINDRKINNKLLSDYKNLLDRSNEAAKIGHWEINLENNDIFWSAVTKKIHEVPSDFQPVLETAINFYPEGLHRDTITKAVEESVVSGIGYDLELQILTAKDNLKWVRAIGIVEKKKNKVVKIYGLFQDIHKSKTASKLLALKEEELRKTFEFAPHGMAFIKPDASITYSNKAFCKMLGYSATELKKYAISQLTHPDDRNRAIALVRRLLNQEIDSYTFERRFVKKSGKVIHTSNSVSLVKDDNGQPIHMALQVQDITKSKETEFKVKALHETTKNQNARLLNFAHIVSHNLRSHSSNIAMLLDLMKTEIPESDSSKVFNYLLNASDNLRDTVHHLNEVVEINTVSNGKSEEINVAQFINAALDSVKSDLLSHGVDVTLDIDSHVYVKGLASYVESIFLNLITNSIKYRSQHRSPKIKISSSHEGGFIGIHFQDNGLGINLDMHRKKLFGMYKTFHHNEEARGIGLFMVKNQIEALLGKIEVQSVPDKGSTFSVFLPYE